MWRSLTPNGSLSLRSASHTASKFAAWKSSLQASRRKSVVLCHLRIGHTWLTHGYLLRREDLPECRCGALLTVVLLLLDCLLLAALWLSFSLPAAQPLIL